MIVAVKQKIEVKDKKFRTAILSLRRTLDLTQEGMARLLGCSFAAFRKWESGAAIPSGKWLLKLLAVCPDEETRRAFGLESGILNLESASPGRAAIYNDAELPAQGRSPLTRQQRQNFQDEMCTAIGIICEHAPGSLVSKLVEQLRRLAGMWADSKPRK